ncbi:cytochrome c [Pseudomonas veronii]|uniref:c-type cytochrome n=1 Tax=Pseudomonas veronii TaxID=76761 RepID=UPI0021BFDC70|nr:cytochrome c [Pseudomonas veronii]MCT8962818.1 cytochrome c [Pseudomonas veronii]
MKSPACLFLVLALSLSGAAYAEQDAAWGKAKKIVNATCISCHGADGVSAAANWPHLAGQKAAYLEKQMIAFRDGTRKNPVMMNMIGGLDDDTIKALARYYASQPQP